MAALPPLLVHIMLAGDSGVGKSTFGQHIRAQQPNEFTQATIGTDILVVDAPVRVADRDICLRLIDVPGSTELAPVAAIFYRGAHYTVLMYDITNRNSFHNIRARWVLDLKSHARVCRGTVLIGNKSDVNMSKRQVSLEEGQQLARELGCVGFYELSAQKDPFPTVMAPIAHALSHLLQVITADGSLCTFEVKQYTSLQQQQQQQRGLPPTKTVDGTGCCT